MNNYVIYCDESTKRGPYFSNFYGGALIKSTYLDSIISDLEAKKQSLGLLGEIKWSKVSAQYLEKYCAIIDTFFNYIKQNKVKIRIMFTHNYIPPVGLTSEQKQNEYFLLYYQFFKHAFGFQHCPSTERPLSLRIYFDRLPVTKNKEEFKRYIYGIQNMAEFRDCLKIKRENIAEIDSHKHVILQCMDIILGSMQFRLNNFHKTIEPGQTRRGKKTRAKEKLYKLINHNIQDIFPHFNIGMSTGLHGNLNNRWNYPYSHWKFVPSNHSIDVSKTKHK